MSFNFKKGLSIIIKILSISRNTYDDGPS